MHDTKRFEPTVTGRSLVPVSGPCESRRPPVVVHPPASFLAHLIATRQLLPQTRERRRVAPETAAAIYAAAGKAVATSRELEFARCY
jgi:hypothetical protein